MTRRKSTAKKATGKKRPIETYEHKGKKRANNPPIGLMTPDAGKAEIDEDLIESYRGSVSLPFEPGEHQRIAVKIVDDRGIESLKIMEVER